jgi:hypothetical protein
MAALVVAVVGSPRSAAAQWVVYDPSNYAQAVTRYLQAVQQYEFFLAQARRLPAAVASRYRVPEIPWGTYDAVAPVLAGLNAGTSVANAYRAAVDPLDAITDVLATTPSALRARLETRYGAIGIADSLAQLAIQQTGTVRASGIATLRAIQAMEDDALAGPDAYHSQTALLNKINGASVLGLRVAEQSTQFLAHTVEQLLLDNLRKRQTETQLMNAQAYRARYGTRYGGELFDQTADRLDSWRQP